MKETTLIKLAAERMDSAQLRAEVERVKRAMQSADTTPKQQRRYQVKLDLLQAEMDARTYRAMQANSPNPQRVCD